MEYKTDAVLDIQGNAVAGAQVRVLDENRQIATVFDADGSEVGNPVSTDSTGEFSVAVANGKYFWEVSVGGRVLETRGPITFFDASDPDSSSQIGFQQAGVGAVVRTVQDKDRERVSVKDFGAIADGASHPLSFRYPTLALAQAFYPHAQSLNDEIDWAAAQATVDYMLSVNERAMVYTAGVYMVNRPVKYSGSKWDVGGDGQSTSIIKSTGDHACFQIDLTAGPSNRGSIHDLGFDHTFTPYENTCGIHVVTDPGVSGGVYKWQFRNIQFQHVYRCMRFGATAKELWQGAPSIEKHSFCEFDNLSVLASTAYQPFECLSFDEGCGPHHTIKGGNLFASGLGSSCIKIGNGGTNNGFGDLLIEGVHMTDAQYGVRLIGPGGPTTYNQNVTVVGCQFDGAGMQYTIYAERMKNCRFGMNNSTSSGAVTLVDCTDISFQDQLNHLYSPSVISGALSRYSNGVTFGARSQVSSLLGYIADFFNWSADTLGSIIMIAKSRGVTPGAHVAVQNGDRIGEIRYVGSDGAAFKPGAMVAVTAAATPAQGDANIPMTMGLRTSPDAATSPVNRVFADEAGNVVLAGDTVSSTPTNGVNGFVFMQKTLGAPTGVPAKSYNGHVPMIIDETNSRIYVRVGGVWKYAQLT